MVDSLRADLEILLCFPERSVGNIDLLSMVDKCIFQGFYSCSELTDVNVCCVNFAFRFHDLDSEIMVHTFSLGKNMNSVNSDMLLKLKCLEMKQSW